MKFLLFTIIVIKITYAIRYRATVEDEIVDCPNVVAGKKFSDYVDMTDFEVNRLDDSIVELGGKIKFIKSFPMSVLEMYITTKYKERGVWVAGPISMILSDLCAEFHKPERPWYNVTYLFDIQNCPPQKDAIYQVKQQAFEMIFDSSRKVPTGEWMAFLNVADLPQRANTFCATTQLNFEEAE